MQANQEVSNPLFQLYKKYNDFSDINQIFCSSLATNIFDEFFRIMPNSRKSEQMKSFFRKSLFSKIMRKNIETISNKLLIYGRINDSIPHLQNAIELGNLTARADLALLYFNQKMPYNQCQKAVKQLKQGVELGCKDCQGMLGYSYTLTSDFDLAYSHSIESADVGSIFGKFAFAQLLYKLSTYQYDKYEETFYILFDDKYISNFTKKNIADEADGADEDYDSALSDFYNDSDILNSYDQKRIAGILFNEIHEEYKKNPNCPKVWVNLPVIRH